MRWTMPGRSAPPMPESVPAQWYSSALTSVPSGCPGAGWTTMPLGLLTTITSASSYTTSSGMSCGTASTGLRFGQRHGDVLAARELIAFADGLPIHRDLAALDEPRRLRAGQSVKARRKKCVEPLIFAFFTCPEQDRFHGPSPNSSRRCSGRSKCSKRVPRWCRRPQSSPRR